MSRSFRVAFSITVMLLAAVSEAVGEASVSLADPQTEPAVATPQSPSTPPKLSRRERRERRATLAERHHRFLEDVEPIIQPVELDTFLLLETDAQRDLYIEDFWSRRDPAGDANNHYRNDYYARLEEARAKYRHRLDPRYLLFMVRGRPIDLSVLDCERWIQPIEVWKYQGSWYVFYIPRRDSVYRLWIPMRNDLAELEELLSESGLEAGVTLVFFGEMIRGERTLPDLVMCPGGLALIDAALFGLHDNLLLTRAFEPPPIERERTVGFLASAVIADPSAPPLPAEISVRYPGQRRGRTDVEISLIVDRQPLVPSRATETSSYGVDVIGEVMKDEILFERFRYRFDIPAEYAGEKIGVSMERSLRPASYVVRLKIRDAHGSASSFHEQPIDVPSTDVTSAEKPVSIDSYDSVALLRILPLPDTTLTGSQMIETIVAGEIIKAVEFHLDGERIMVKRSPPFSLRLDLGSVPQLRRIRVLGLDAAGEVLDGDEIVVNAGRDQPRIRIISPRFARSLRGTIRVETEPAIPEGKALQQVEIFLNDDRVATLYGAPWAQNVTLPPGGDIGFLRAVATFDDGTVTDDLVLINAPEAMEQVVVHLVEAPVTVVDASGRPVTDLEVDAFRLFDGDTEVELVKFERVENLPLSIGLAIDTSESMRTRIAQARGAASGFLHQILRDEDRAFLVSFDARPQMIQRWTGDKTEIDRALVRLRSEEATALWDAIIFALYTFRGVDGRKALVLISDGADTISRYSHHQTLEYARRSGVPIYTIGIDIHPVRDALTRSRLGRLSEETGGTAWFVSRAEELESVYRQIEQQLRSQYLLGFYPSPAARATREWRPIHVEVTGGTARTIRGYYP